ncbi:phage tail tape measure protein [uncultured Streptococcus sp.]|uniref:phage tail tape measure protein n=1 Tax=uncultured Streptococcus sp. TaxID=83427 RepID=UPI0026765C26|nr:phage tail tape measure protein [uncultured Streptococcus sp.]
MASNLGELVATASLDIQPFIGNTKQLSTYMRGLDKSLSAMEKSFKNVGKGGKDLAGMRTVLGETANSIKAYEGILKQQTEHYNNLKSKIGDLSSASAKNKEDLLGARNAMLQTATTLSDLRGRYADLTKEINIQSSKWTQVGNGLQSFGEKMQGIGSKMQGVGSTLTKGLTVPLLAGAGVAVKAAIDYESAFAGVKKTVDGTPQQFAKLSNSIREMSREMPSSAVEIAHVAEAAGQLGVPIGAIKDFSKTMINLGVSTNLSSEEAASSIAKIGNIMQVSGKDLGTWSGHFGSAVVDLGNHFATTERDIVEMTNRLAAGGKLAGLTTPEILGLATAMSSVGIEAEAGGTAMNQTLTGIGKAVAGVGKGAKEKLQLIASTAGMTAEQFSTAWKQKPAEALQAFIKGLQRAHDEGKNMDGILDELDMSGIRQGNMMKSLASASDKMSEAVSRSNSAWKENSALTNEASKRYETTESQLKIFKNKLTDIAIEFGGPLLKALNSGLDAAKPWLQTLSDMAKKFSEMSTEQQQSILKWGALAAAIGPALKIFGSAASVIGAVAKGIGAFSGMLKTISNGGGFINGLKQMATGMTATGTAAETAAVGAGKFGSAVSLLGNPVTWGVLAGGAALLYVGSIAKSMAEADERTRTWGTSVNKVQAEELTKLKAKVDDAHEAMVGFGNGGAQAVENVRKSVQGLSNDLQKAVDKDLEKTLKGLEKIGASDEIQKRAVTQAEQQKKNIQTMTDEIIQIYQNASDQHRKITREEQAVIYDYENQFISKQLELQKYSADQRTAITKAMNGQINDLNETQLSVGVGVVEKWIKDENKLYKEQVETLKDAHAKGIYSQSEYNQKMEELNSQHKAKMEAFGREYAALQKRLSEKSALKLSDDNQRKYYFEGLRKSFADLGLDYDKMMAKADQFSDIVGRSSGMVAKSLENMSAETKDANLAWNNLVFDPKTGQVKTNAQEEVTKALQAENGWENMQFILKHANLETNAKMTIGEALVETGKWDSLSLQEKELVVGNNQGMKAVLDSKTLLEQYNAMPAEVKELLMKNTDFLSSGERATAIIERWNTLTPEQKELILKDAASDKAERVRLAVDSLTGMAHVVNLDAQDKTQSAIASAMSSILTLPTDHKTDLIATPDGVTLGSNLAMNALGLFNNFAVPDKHLNADASNATSAAQQAINKQQEWNNTPSPTKPQTGDPSSAINAAQQAIYNQNAWNNTPSPVKGIYADSSGAVGAALAAASAITSIPTSWTTVITTIANSIKGHAKGTDFHEGGLAMVNDQGGTLYKEMVTLPDGSSFVPEGRNVILDLPRGSKVMRAGLTKNFMRQLGIPNFADGVGWKHSEVANVTQRIKNVNEWKRDNEQRDLVPFIQELINQVKRGNDREERPNQNYTLNVHGNSNGQDLTPEFMKRLMRELAYYTNQEGRGLA